MPPMDVVSLCVNDETFIHKEISIKVSYILSKRSGTRKVSHPHTLSMIYYLYYEVKHFKQKNRKMKSSLNTLYFNRIRADRGPDLIFYKCWNHQVIVTNTNSSLLVL